MSPFDSYVIPSPAAVPTALPAARIVSIDTNEFDEFNETTAGWSVQHHALSASCRSSAFLAATASLQVGVVQHTTGYSSQGANPAGTITVAVPVDDARPMVHRGHLIQPIQLGLMRSGEGFECLCRSGIRFVVASFAQAKAELYAADLWHQPNLASDPLDRLRFVDAEHRSRYLDTCRRFVDVVHDRPGVLADRQTAALLEEQIFESLFVNARVSPSDASESIRYNVARRAYDYLRDRRGDVPSIRTVCAVTGASYSTLERGFRETYGMSPKAMMTAMRLSGARRALLHPCDTTTVTAVALRWGFVEFGRFSVLYRRHYGEMPSETLRRARGIPPSRHAHRALLPLTKSA
jgi:AraC family ethanolamine operon transcriptional activator